MATSTMDHSLKDAVTGVLRPLVRYLIRRGATYPGLCAWLKAIYVQEAEHVGPAEAGLVTDSRIALLTGIHRKDVARLRVGSESLLRPSRAASIAARVVAQWCAGPSYLDAEGRPAVLPIKRSGAASFEDLVRHVKADLRANVILEELERVGVAAREGTCVRLLRTAYVSDLPEEKLHFLGANVGDHLACVTHNLETPDDPFIERAVYYDGIPVDLIPALRSRLFRTAEGFIREVNRMIMPLDDRHREVECRRVRLGVFYYEDRASEPVNQEREQSS
ncbi:MAG: DUF6502 family protein [Acidiferrobacteraceae bacterium]